MTNTYSNELPKHYLTVKEGQYEVKELTLNQIIYLLPEGECYETKDGRKFGSQSEETPFPAFLMVDLAQTRKWRNSQTGEVLTLDSIKRKTRMTRESLTTEAIEDKTYKTEGTFILQEVEPIDTNVFYTEIDEIGVYYRMHGKEVEEIQEGETAYLYAKKQGMRLFSDLAFDFNGRVEIDTMEYWDDIPYIQLETGRVEVFELQIDQKKKRAQLAPRRLTHILMDLKALTLN